MKSANSLVSYNFLFSCTKQEVTNPFQDGIAGNPVGDLQEFCMSRRLPLPSYKLSADEGLPHERLFTIDCIVGKNKAGGACYEL